jgi:hypothetical protein
MGGPDGAGEQTLRQGVAGRISATWPARERVAVAGCDTLVAIWDRVRQVGRGTFGQLGFCDLDLWGARSWRPRRDPGASRPGRSVPHQGWIPLGSLAALNDLVVVAVTDLGLYNVVTKGDSLVLGLPVQAKNAEDSTNRRSCEWR